MRAVGLKVLKNKLSQYVRAAAAGETVLVTDRDLVRGVRPAEHHARRLVDSHGDHGRWVLGRLVLVELVSPVLARALDSFAAPVRTLDALHLASLEFLRDQGMTLELAAYDDRMRSAARRMKIPLSRVSSRY